ncbi:MAG: chemotaxis protein CheW [Rickettsiales bacterium]|nr:chemotaxis protein CheW [Pseudomonadota bacterium]MDA0965484.1 chemotaxis protein CheW [Pseudomonadota bacterium]MDG4542808.1 chemotaxis protein CheW [Rickettsiales bacterium]MDG4544744.1 chemotaxis protein CheW [Rickettsiales bacterium]MDG4546866.1 chemotaxis protein CheW [Rickettsiales bacterium]
MVKEQIDEIEGSQSEGKSQELSQNDVRNIIQEHQDIAQFLTFKVDNELYGVDLLSIREIKGWTETTRLPNSPPFMKGVINLRGAVIPIFDLKGRFDMGETKATEKHVVIIIAVGQRLIGILVDAVSDIIEVAQNDIKQAPQMEMKVDDKFVKGLISLDDKMVVVLDINSLFDSQDIKIDGNRKSDMKEEA